MKKTTLLVLVIFALIQTTRAQSIKLGVKAGANFTELKSEDAFLKSENNAGYLLGVWGRVGAGIIHIQPEAYFTSKNTTVEIEPKDAPGSFVKGDLKFTNIDVPLLIGTKFPLGPIKGRIQAGPLFSFKIDESNSLKDNIDATYSEALNSYKDKFSAIVGGLGLDIFNFSIDARYEYGLGNISKNSNHKQTLNLWTVSLGYSFL